MSNVKGAEAKAGEGACPYNDFRYAWLVLPKLRRFADEPPNHEAGNEADCDQKRDTDADDFQHAEHGGISQKRNIH
jgi:hypothetical protein